jgi:hypothetical protein
VCQPTPPDNDPDIAAAILADANQPPEVRNKAAKYLMTVIEQIARQIIVRKGLHPWGKLARCLMEDCVAHVYMAILEKKYDPTKGKIIPWIRKVLINCLIDCIRSHEDDEQLGIIENYPDPSAKVHIFHEPFSPHDLEEVRRWQPLRDRVLILVLAGLWRKVPSKEWRCWVETCGWPWPFPPETVCRCDEPRQRITPLAQAVNMRANTLTQIWHRKKSWLKNLKCIQELGEPD